MKAVWIGIIGCIAMLLVPLLRSHAAERVPWTTSKIQGSPEPPPPYVPERVLHEHKFRQSTEIDFIPESKWAVLLEQRGKVYAIEEGKPEEVHELANIGEWTGGRIELYSIAFHPNWKTNRFVFIAFFDQKERPQLSNVVRFELKPGSPPTLDLESGKLVFSWVSSGHKGGDIGFGHDGFLYIPIGDGVGPTPPDPKLTGQDLSDFFASILRIDIDHSDGDKAYRVPKDNPFVSTPGARPEIWAYGFRNPWKICFDPRDGALWTGDVGWTLWEMVFRIDRPGFNGGWSIVEGPNSVHPKAPLGPTPIQKPVVSHPHTEATSISGGIVYRGSRLPELRNAYIYGDWGTGKIWALWWKDGAIAKRMELASTGHRVVGFAENAAHELFYINHSNGGVYRLAPNPNRATVSTNFPQLLSKTGLFSSTQDHTPAPGVYRFDITAPSWNDHATAERLVAFPGLSKAVKRRNFIIPPKDTVFTRTLSIETKMGDPKSSKKVESQLLHFDGVQWHGYSYRWLDDQSDAKLVKKEGEFASLDIVDMAAPNGKRLQRWRFHARSECVRCHVSDYDQRHGNLNAFTFSQLASLKHEDGFTEFERLIELGLIEKFDRGTSSNVLANPHDASAPLERRARSYLHANCAHCHHPGSTGGVVMMLPATFSSQQTAAFDVEPTRGAFGIADGRIIASAHPERSVLLYRMLTTGHGRMPAIGSHEVDEQGALLLRDWIESLEVPAAPPTGGNDSNDDTSDAVAKALNAIDMDSTKRAKAAAQAMRSNNMLARDLFLRFLPADQRRRELGADFDPELLLGLQGDHDRGSALFFGPGGPACSTCHRIGGKGRDYGPDLSAISQLYTRKQILTHIINPSDTVKPEWTLRQIQTSDEKLHVGFVAKSDDTEIHLKTAIGETVVIAREKMKSDKKIPGGASVMPPGALDQLTAQEAADLLEFLSR